jgi:VWFA-related protein
VRRAAVSLLCWIGTISAQTPPFHVQTQVVQVPVSVADRNGHRVEGLDADDFVLFDDAVRQEVTVDDYVGFDPISLVIAVQTSGISTPALAKVRRIGGLIQPFISGQRGAVAVVTFDRRVTWLQDFTSNDDEIRSALNSLRPGKALQDARMLDAVGVVAGHMQHRSGRKILLLISESRDRGSETTIEQAIEAVERQNIEVFAARYSAYASSLIAKPKDLPDLSSPPELPDDPTQMPNPPPAINFMSIFAELARLGHTNSVQALTRATGGLEHSFVKQSGIDSAIEKLGAAVHDQYVLSFPQRHDAAPGIHQIDLSVAGRADVQLRWRHAYWAEGPEPAQ